MKGWGFPIILINIKYFNIFLYNCFDRHRGCRRTTSLVFAFLLVMIPSGGHCQDHVRSSQTSNPSYCGIQSLYRVMRSLGKDVSFRDLVDPKYIGDRQGSSEFELSRAAQDYGLYTLPFHHASFILLYNVNDPVILHVKASLGHNEFDHWILFMGIEGGKARICDGSEPIKMIGLDELAELWDGNGLIISRQPIAKWEIYLSSIVLYGIYIGIGIGIINIVIFLQRMQSTASWATSLGIAARVFDATREVIVLLTLSALIWLSYRYLSPEGFLSCKSAIKAIQDSFIFETFDTIGDRDVALHERAQDVTFVDARISTDYADGHIRNAINIGVNWDATQCAAALARVPKTAPIVIYCNDRRCPFSKMVGIKIRKLGYTNIFIYEGGWVTWKQYALQAGSQH